MSRKFEALTQSYQDLNWRSHERNWVIVANPNFLIPISVQPDDANHWHCEAKMKEFKNQSLRQRLNSFNFENFPHNLKSLGRQNSMMNAISTGDIISKTNTWPISNTEC